MRLVIQRVKKAKVTKVKTNEIVGEIGEGLFILLGIKKGDSEEKADYLAQKVAKLRIMKDGEKKMNLSISDTKGEILVVSQFTLYGDSKGQNRPSFIEAAEPELAKKVYERFITKLKDLGIKVQTGSFGDYMEINTSLDGPVTILLEE
jgi:D-tyrosyl-tRNA(Tyr) deacylase